MDTAAPVLGDDHDGTSDGARESKRVRGLARTMGLLAIEMPIVRFDGSRECYLIPYVPRVVRGGPDLFYLDVVVGTLPVALAHAFTVHKVQGITLDCPVAIDMARSWPCDHLVYVAMSRVRRLDQLYLSNLNEDQVRANRSAHEFSHQLIPAQRFQRASEGRLRSTGDETADDQVVLKAVMATGGVAAWARRDPAAVCSSV